MGIRGVRLTLLCSLSADYNFLFDIFSPPPLHNRMSQIKLFLQSGESRRKKRNKERIKRKVKLKIKGFSSK